MKNICKKSMERPQILGPEEEMVDSNVERYKKDIQEQGMIALANV